MAERPPVNAPLSYMPMSFRRRTSDFWKFVYLGAIAAAGFAIFDWFHPGETFAVLISQATIVLLLAAGGIVAAVQHWTVDCRIEGTTLTIENRPMLARISVQISDITEIATLVHPENAPSHEMTVNGMGRINVGPELFTPLQPLKAALLEINPGITFSQRSSNICPACGCPRIYAETSIFRAIAVQRAGRCTNCGEPFARRSRFT